VVGPRSSVAGTPPLRANAGPAAVKQGDIIPATDRRNFVVDDVVAVHRPDGAPQCLRLLATVPWCPEVQAEKRLAGRGFSALCAVGRGAP
jgi:hypothetical protein